MFTFISSVFQCGITIKFVVVVESFTRYRLRLLLLGKRSLLRKKRNNIKVTLVIDRIHVQGIHIGFSHSHESPKAQRQPHGTVHLSWKENTYGSS